MEYSALEKTNRINLLFDFYQELLTDKQQMFLKYYFHDNYSLSEIAAEFAISRQAVYEHIKRAEHILEDYEAKLHLLADHERRTKALGKIREQIDRLSEGPLKTELLLSLEWMQQTE